MTKYIFRFLIIAMVGAAFAFFAHRQLSSSSLLTGIDDANILFVYAQNLAEGHGFVYNIGSEKVEGFTSFLWVMICAGVFAISSQPEYVLLVINILLMALSLTACSFFLERWIKKGVQGKMAAFLTVLYLIFTLASPRYVAWMTVTLMDSALWSFLIVCSTLFIINIKPQTKSYMFGLLLFLLLITRPESMLWGLVFITLAGLRVRETTELRKTLSWLTFPIVVYVVTLSAIIIVRIQYFGYPLPNTYYAKVSSDRLHNLVEGVKYMVSYLVNSDLLTVASVILILFQGIYVGSAIVKRLKTKANLWRLGADAQKFTLWAICFIGLLMPLFSGGDHFGSNRFYQFFYPLFMINLLIFLLPYLKRVSEEWTIQKPHGSLMKKLVLVAILLLPVLSQGSSWRFLKSISLMGGDFGIAYNGRITGQWMEGSFKDLAEYPQVGVIVAGGIKLAYPGYVFDLMGLNHIAMGHSPGDRNSFKGHAAFNKEIFYQSPPHILGPIWKSAVQAKLLNFQKKKKGPLTLKGITEDIRFMNMYDYARITRMDEPSSGALEGYFLETFLQQLDTSKQFKIESYHD